MNSGGWVRDWAPEFDAAASRHIELLRLDLADAGYAVEALRVLWGESAEAALARGQRMPALMVLERLRASGGLPAAGTLAWCFVLGLPVAADELEAALPRTGLWQGVLVERDSDRRGGGDRDLIRPLVDLRPYAFADDLGPAQWWIASDLGEAQSGGALHPDHVLGVGGASLTLSRLLFASDVETALDLGTGCGIQALHLTRFAHRVVATDVSERALRFARFNAALNGVGNIEFRLGSLFEPVRGERFDRVASNPPFVITPRRGVPEFDYRDGGMTGDDLVETLVESLGAHLEPGGVAQLLGNWEYRGGRSGLSRVREWTRGLDAWVVEREVQDAAEYAETWIRDGGTRPGDADFEPWYRTWLDDFASRGTEKVGFGYLMLRRPTGGAPLERFEHVGASVADGVGAHIRAALAAHDRLAALTDDELLAARLVVAPDVTEERHSWPGDESPVAIILHQGGGFGRALEVDPGLAGLVGACDGELPVGAIIAALATIFDVDEVELAAGLLPRVRELVFTGFLGFAAS